MGTSEEEGHSRMAPPDARHAHQEHQQHQHLQHMPPPHHQQQYMHTAPPLDHVHKHAAAGMLAFVDTDPTQEISQASPISPHPQFGGSMLSQQQQQQQAQWEPRPYRPIHLPAGPVATPITRFLTKQTLGFIPPTGAFGASESAQAANSPSAQFALPRINVPSASAMEIVQDGASTPGMVALPPLQQACASPPRLPSLAQCLDDVCRPMPYQRSLSCPSDAMQRALHGPSPPPGSDSGMSSTPSSPIPAQVSDARIRLERSSSMDSRSMLAAQDAAMQSAYAYASEYTTRPETIGLHRWPSLESLAESANLQGKMGAGMISPRGVGSDVHYDSPGCHSTASEPRREKKLCAFPECTSNAVTRGLCISHGGGRRCQRKGCTRGAQSKGLCVAHGGGRICKARGCSNIQRSMGLCIRHGGGKRCSVPGCQKGVVRQDLCTAHGGKRKCRVDGCNKHVKKKGLCRAHANAAALASPLRDMENLSVSSSQ